MNETVKVGHISAKKRDGGYMVFDHGEAIGHATEVEAAFIDALLASRAHRDTYRVDFRPGPATGGFEHTAANRGRRGNMNEAMRKAIRERATKLRDLDDATAKVDGHIGNIERAKGGQVKNRNLAFEWYDEDRRCWYERYIPMTAETFDTVLAIVEVERHKMRASFIERIHDLAVNILDAPEPDDQADQKVRK